MRKVTYVGLDVHKEMIVGVWGKAKEETRSGFFPNTQKGRRSLVRAVGKGPAWGVYEASSCGFGLYDELVVRGWKMAVVAPTHLEKSVHGRISKTDPRDAEDLQGRLMAHGELGKKLPKIWIPPHKIRQDREVIRRRLDLGDSIGRVKVKILSLLRMHEIEKPEGCGDSWTKKHLAWLSGLTAKEADLARPLKQSLASLLRELGFLMGERKELDSELQGLSQEPAYEARVKKMTERKGVGTLTALTYLVELGDPNRFENRKKVAAYMGLVPSSFESGTDKNGRPKDRKGHITRMGPARVRKVLNQAAWAYLRENQQERAWYWQLSRRRGKKKAIVALMRKLGIELWHLACSA